MLVSIEKWRISCRYRPKKQSIKVPANPQIFSDRQTILNHGTLPRKVTVGPPSEPHFFSEKQRVTVRPSWTSDLSQESNKWLSDYLQPRNSLRKSDLNLGTLLKEMTSELGTFLRNQIQSSLISISLSVRSSLWILIGLSVMLEDLNIKLDLHKLPSSLYTQGTQGLGGLESLR